MASTFGSLEIAKSGMMAYNAALQTTAHNVANIETKGYSKQTVNMVSLVGNKTSVTVQGFGVNVASIHRKPKRILRYEISAHAVNLRLLSDTVLLSESITGSDMRKCNQ